MLREQKEEEARKKKAVWGRERNGRDGSVPGPPGLTGCCVPQWAEQGPETPWTSTTLREPGDRGAGT